MQKSTPAWARTVPTAPGEARVEPPAAPAPAAPTPEQPSWPAVGRTKGSAEGAQASTQDDAGRESGSVPEETDIWPPEPPTEHTMPAWPPSSTLDEGLPRPATIPSWSDSFEAVSTAKPKPAPEAPQKPHVAAPAPDANTKPPPEAPGRNADTLRIAAEAKRTTPPAAPPRPATIPPAMPTPPSTIPAAASSPPAVRASAPPAAAEPPSGASVDWPGSVSVPSWAPRIRVGSDRAPDWSPSTQPVSQVAQPMGQPPVQPAPTPRPAPPPAPTAAVQQPAVPPPPPPPPAQQPNSAPSAGGWAVVEQKQKVDPSKLVPTPEDRSYAEWFAWAKRGGAPASACHAAAQGAFQALSSGKDVAIAVQWATAAMTRPPVPVSAGRQTYCAWFSLANIDLNLDQHRAHAFATGAVHALDAGADAARAHAAGLAAAGVH
jgi:hypothetical protein